MIVQDPWFYVLAVPAVLLIGISKGGLAGGLGLLAVPMLTLVIPPLQAAGILLPILVVMDFLGLAAYRRSWHRRNVAYLSLGAVVGIAIGTLTAGVVTDDHVRLLVGLVAVLFALDFWIGRRERRAARPVQAGRGILAGGVAGFTSFVAHAGAPPFQFYMLPQKLDKTLYVGTSVIFFWIVNLLKLPPYALLGQLAPTNLRTSLILMPLAPLGIWLGLELHHRIPERPFYRICYGLLLVVGSKLVWDGLRGL